MSNVCKPCKIDLAKMRYNLSKQHPGPQSGAQCQSCGRVDMLHLDHCHNTEKNRGWVCKNCNVGFGHLGDSIEGLERALRYLRRASRLNERREDSIVEETMGGECLPECNSVVQVGEATWFKCEKRGCGELAQESSIDISSTAA